MKNFILYVFTTALGCAFFYGIGWLGGLMWQPLQFIIFYGGSAWWAWTAYKYQQARKAGHFELPSEAARREVGEIFPPPEKPSGYKKPSEHISSQRNVQFVAFSSIFMGKPVTEFAGITEMESQQKKALLAGSPMGKGENVHNATDSKWIGVTWKVTLGTLNGIVYKVAYQYYSRDLKAAKEVEKIAKAEIIKLLAKGEAHGESITIWDGSNGNVVLQTAMVNYGMSVDVFVTGKI